MSHCRFEGENIPSDWNSIPLGNEKYVCTVYINLYTALHVHLTDYRVRPPRDDDDARGHAPPLGAACVIRTRDDVRGRRPPVAGTPSVR